MVRIKYIGAADVRTVRNTDFAAAGFVQATLEWKQSNNKEQSVTDDIAIFLLSFPADFQTIDGMNLQQFLATGNGGRTVDKAWNRTGNIYSTAGAALIIPGTSRTVQVGERPICIHFKGYLYNGTAASSSWIELREGAVVLDQCGHTSGVVNGAAVDYGYWEPDVKPSVGPHTYDLYLTRTGGTANVLTGANAPCGMVIKEC